MKKKKLPQIRETQYNNREIQQIIVDAIIEADEIRKDKENNEVKKEIHEWQEKIGYKEATGKNFFEKAVSTFANHVRCVSKMPFLKEKEIEGTYITFVLIKYILERVLACIMFLIALLALVFLFSFIKSAGESNIREIILAACFTIVLLYTLLIFWASLRIAKIEVKKTTDKNFIWGIVATFAMVAAIISIVLDISQFIKQLI